MDHPLLITILGPTACGKTSLAVALAARLDGEIISADSRQVFRGMDIGTGKDLSEYSVIDETGGCHTIPHHLIDICDAGEEYSVYRFQQDFIKAFNSIVANQHQPILCGGTGMYIESVVRNYRMPDAPIDDTYRSELEAYSDEELTERLASYIKLHNHTDTETRERLLRALEIQEFGQRHPDAVTDLPPMRHLIIGIRYPREEVIRRIGIRLHQRLDEGMVDEVKRLLDMGVPHQRLLRYGLEYKHLTRYLTEDYPYDTMVENLYTDIRRFSKRQMTWFRRMERNGVEIHWIDGLLDTEQKLDAIDKLLHPAGTPSNQ